MCAISPAFTFVRSPSTTRTGRADDTTGASETGCTGGSVPAEIGGLVSIDGLNAGGLDPAGGAVSDTGGSELAGGPETGVAGGSDPPVGGPDGTGC